MTLRRAVRTAAGGGPEPSAGVLERHSVKTPEHSEPIRVGYDPGQPEQGRKRHILVDTLGGLWLAIVTTADLQDRTGAEQPRLNAEGQRARWLKIWAGRAWPGSLVDGFARIVHECLKTIGLLAEQIRPCVQFKRWSVERTLGWLNRFRCPSKDHELYTLSFESVISLASTRLLLTCLAADRRNTTISS